MKTLLLIILVSFAFTTTTNANNYYFSTVSGDDSRTSAQAQNSSTPWKTLSKLNSIFSTLQAGDSILFKRGETFYGTINVNKSGTVSRPIVIGAYGTGNKPVITGMQTLTNWVSVGNGKYESTNTALGPQVNMVTLNGVEQDMGRYPNRSAGNGGYLNFESHVNNSSITDNQLSSSNVWTGAELVVRTNRYIIDRTKITSNSGNTISYSPALSYMPIDGFGYFIQNDIRTLDQLGEWYYNPSTKKMTIYFGSNNPSAYTVKASAVGQLAYVHDVDNITLSNISFTGGNNNSVYLYSTVNTVIKDCDVSFSGIDGIQANNTINLKIENSTVVNTNNIGINLSNSKYGILRNNKVKNTGLILGLGQNTANKTVGIRETGRYNLVEFNQVDSTAFIAIRFGGDYAVIKNNFVNHFTLTKDDGSGIYTSNNGVGRKIIGNIILNGHGAAEGTSSPVAGSTSGIYLDDAANQIEVNSNTIADCNKTGIYVHNAHEVTVLKNTMFNSPTQLTMVHDGASPNHSLRNNVLKNNILFSKDASQTVFNLGTINNDVSLSAGTMDSNYYCRPLDDNFVLKTYFTNAAGTRIYQDLDLPLWKSVYGKDQHSKKTATSIIPHKIKGLIGTNKFANESFNTNISGLSFGTTGTSATKAWVDNKIDAGTFQVVISSAKAGLTTATISIGAVSTSKKYVIGFTVKNSKDTLMYVYARQPGLPYKVLSNGGAKTILRMTPSRKDYELAFTPTVNESNAIVFLETPSQDATWWLDNVKVYEANVAETNPDDSIRFEYNPTQLVKTVNLGGKYTDVKGTVYTNSINLEPYSSAILIKNNGGVVTQAPNVAPTVSITTPVANTTYTAPAAITINATADDADGSISKVEFYNGSTLLGTDNTSPYSFTWNNATEGNFTITAKASDNGSLVTTSSPVTLSVLMEEVTPTVSITTPVSNATFEAPAGITINAQASVAKGSISKVSFYNGNKLLGNDNTSPYAFTWSNVASGTYEITAKATDNHSRVASSSVVTISVVNPHVAPTVSITTPVSNATYTTPAGITIDATASDADGSVSKVEFYIGNKLIGSDNKSPYTFTWSNATAGTYSVTAKATDNSSLATTSAAITIVVSNPNVAPTVSITTPVSNTSFTAPESITITAKANDEDGSVSKVEFYNGNILLGSDSKSPYTFTWQNVAAGNYAITAKATDNNSSVTSSPAVTVVVFNPNVAPTVSITSPVSDAAFTASESITITAKAGDEDGSVSKVEFYNGNTLLGSDSKSPYTFTWKNVAAGSYAITAKATDNGSLVTSSSAITIVVSKPNVAPTVSITSPVSTTGFTAPAGITITADANDEDGSVSKVEFYNGNILLHTEVAAPYTWTWENMAAGTYVLTAKATDNGSLVTSSSAIIIVVSKPNVAPTVSITSPVSNTGFTAPAGITITANANDEDGSVSKVEFYNGNTLLHTEVAAPYTWTWENIPAGTYVFRVKATDNGSLVTSSSAVTVVVSKPNVAPTVTITSPVSTTGFTAPAGITITADANDEDGSVNKVEFYNGNTLVHTEVAAPYTWTWENIPAGTYVLTAKATDNGSLVTSSSAVAIVVSEPNAAPAVSITSPVSNTSFTAPAGITITADANDEDGSISKVEFYNGTTLLTTEKYRPYTYSWQNAPVGNYVITAVATDNKGLSTSTAISVTVVENSAPVIKITSPGVDTSYTSFARVNLSATATDKDGTISKVEFFNGNTLLATERLVPYTYSWKDVPAGKYRIIAITTDNSGLTSSDTVSVTVTQNIAPGVGIINPTVNTTYTSSAVIDMEARASDTDGTISKVEFFSGGVLLRTERFVPYTFRWKNVPAGKYVITAIATDNNGLSTSDSVSVTVTENIAPAVSISATKVNTGRTSSATIKMSALANDTDGTINKVEFFIGSALLETQRIAPYTYTWKNVPAGNYVITAVATDNNGLTTSDSVTINIEGQPLNANRGVLTPSMGVAVAGAAATTPDISINKMHPGYKSSLEALTMKVGPNPASSVISIFPSGAQMNKDLKISIVSVSGNVVTSIQAKGSDKAVQLNIASLNPGVYIIQVSSGEDVVYKQFVKQ